MAKTLKGIERIDQQTLELSNSIKETIDELVAQIAPLNERYRRLTGDDFLRVELLQAGATTSVNGRAKDTAHRGNGSANGGGSAPGGGAARKAAAGSGDDGSGTKAKRRTRRTPEELTKQADGILSFIKKGGQDGVTGSAIRAEFGQILPSVKLFLKQYGGKTVKSKGEKAGMTYHVSD